MSRVQYRTITISSMLDGYTNGQKRSTFVSATVDLNGVSVEEFRIEQLKVGLEVVAAAIQNAVCRMELNPEEAQTRMTEIKENYKGLIGKLEEKQKSKSSDGEEEPQTPF